MTLIVAGVTDAAIWMVGDTAITEGTISLREREFMPKIEVGQTFSALIGFAGGPEHGSRTAMLAAAAQTPQDALNILTSATLDKGVEFVYANFDSEIPKLRKIAGGYSTEYSTLHIGSNAAFSVFQKIRHGESDPYAPRAFKQFMCGFDISVPEVLANAITSMIDTFVSRPEHDVGGWAVPYLLTPGGAHFCNYVYSVSDPVFDQLIPGSLIGHGTAEGGGATLSVTALPNNDGMAVYWLQLPGGLVMVRTGEGYSKYQYRGGPSEFKSAVRASLSREVELWVGDQQLGPPRSLKIIRGEGGRLDFTIADHGNGLTFAVHNLASKFIHDTVLAKGEEPFRELPQEISLTKLSNTNVGLTVSGTTLPLDAKGVDAILGKLAEMRADLRPEVPFELENVAMVAAVNPGWRTYPSLHPGLPGLTLNLRHPGYGWLGFVLPYHEARKLGQWLQNAAGQVQRPQTVAHERVEGATASDASHSVVDPPEEASRQPPDA